MRKKRKKIGLIFILLVYILVSPEREGRIFRIIPQWIINRNDSVSEASKDSRVIPFRMGNIFGYFSKEGKLTYKDTVFYGVAQNDEKFINYSSITDQIVINDSRGDFLNTVSTNGYPLFRNDRLFVVSTNRKKISEISLDGEQLWSDENLSEITSLDSNSSSVVAGYVNGDVMTVNQDYKIDRLFKPDLSRINTVYGTGISDNSEYIAVISGIEPQYMLLFRKNHDKFTKIFSYQFVNNLRYSRLIDFTDDNKYLYFGSNKTFYCYNIEKRNLYKIPSAEKLIKVSYIHDRDIFCILSSDSGDVYRTVIAYSDGRIIYDNSFSAENIYMKNDSDNIYIGVNDKIYSVKIGIE